MLKHENYLVKVATLKGYTGSNHTLTFHVGVLRIRERVTSGFFLITREQGVFTVDSDDK